MSKDEDRSRHGDRRLTRWLFAILVVLVVIGAGLYYIYTNTYKAAENSANVQIRLDRTAINLANHETVSGQFAIAPGKSWRVTVAVYKNVYPYTKVKGLYDSLNNCPPNPTTPTCAYEPAGVTNPNANWDGTDSSGRLVTAGQYFIGVQVYTPGRIRGTWTLVSNERAREFVAVTNDAGGGDGGGGGDTVAAVTLSSISPSTINPANGEVATISYKVNTAGQYTMQMLNPSSSVILSGSTTYQTGNYSVTWNGKKLSGAAYPDGDYTFQITHSSGAKATGKVTVRTSSQPVGSVRMYEVSPATINPTNSETATANFAILTAGNFNVFIEDSSARNILTLATRDYTVGNQSISWDGKVNGTRVADGTYKFVVKNTANTDRAEGTVTVSTSVDPPTTPTTGTLGNLIFGAAANNAQVKDQGYAVCFKSDRTATASSFGIQWKGKPYHGGVSGDYAGGNNGSFSFTLVKQNSSHMPTTTSLGSKNLTPGNYEGALTIGISAALTANEYYCIVVKNIGSNPTANWSSVNNLQAPAKAWDGIGGLRQNGSSWQTWINPEHVFNGTGSSQFGGKSGQLPPYIINWSDGSTSGDPYYWGTWPGNTISSSKNVAEYIHWDRETTTIKQIGVGIHTLSGTLVYHLDDITAGTSLVSGNMGSLSTSTFWSYSPTFTPVTLTKGHDYRLWFSVSGGQAKTYFPIADTSPWQNYSYGGTSSFAQVGTNGGSWSSAIPDENCTAGACDGRNLDLPFDFVAAQ